MEVFKANCVTKSTKPVTTPKKKKVKGSFTGSPPYVGEKWVKTKRNKQTKIRRFYLITASAREEIQIIDFQGLHAQGTLHLFLTTLIQHRHADDDDVDGVSRKITRL